MLLQEIMMLMKKINTQVILLCSALIAGTITLPVLAEPTTINVDGNIIASPCEVSSDSITKTIALDGGNGFQAKDLQTPGASTEWVRFDIVIKECPEGTNNVTITFSGTPDDTNPESMYVNTGTAKNVAVEIQSHDGLYMFGNGKSYTGSILSDRTFTFRERTRAYTSEGGVTPGTIQAVVTANFTYQ